LIDEGSVSIHKKDEVDAGQAAIGAIVPVLHDSEKLSGQIAASG